LLRWPDECGFVEPPGVFIPLAEQSGLIVKIGAWVLEEVCSERTRLAAAGFGLLKMAVNVSLPQFHKTGFVDDVEGILRRHRMPGGLLEVEITESTVVDEPRMVLPGLQALKRLGVTIAIDDFGMGHSSFRHLRSLPIDCLKLDPSLVKEIGEGKGGMFAESILHRIGKLGMLSVAEGVENLEQAALLRRLGCTVGQGYLYAAPMPASQLHAWLGEYAPAGRNSDAHAPLL
jgi:EAL domain-containing protein (putative c-di-GMP-specific phosphodiesterase class I)